MKAKARIVLCGLAGLAAGTAAASLRFPGYKHAMVQLAPGTQAGPIHIDGSRRQLLALSLSGLAVRNVEVRMQGARIGSWYPPAIRLPFSKVPSFSDGIFRDVGPDRKLPVYVAFDSDGTGRSIDFVNAKDGTLIKSVAVMRGGADGGHQH